MTLHKAYSIEEAKRALERYCAYQERNHQEVQHKLQKMGMIPEVQEIIILHLLQHDFLNEERYAIAYSGGKFRINKWGKIKIRQALLQKGISIPNINIGLATIDTPLYKETILELIKKRMIHHRLDKKELNYKDKQKIAHYLQQKGFESPFVYECLQEIL